MSININIHKHATTFRYTYKYGDEKDTFDEQLPMMNENKIRIIKINPKTVIKSSFVFATPTLTLSLSHFLFSP